MQSLPEALLPLAAHRQFILYKLTPSTKKPGKMDKYPVDHRTLQVYAKGSDWQNDPDAWTTFEHASACATMAGTNHAVGFFLRDDDPFFFVDLDECLNPEGSGWSAVAMDLMGMLNGAAVEISQSGRGLHIIGTGTSPEHACKNTSLGLEMYTGKRFIALTGTNTIGSAAVNLTTALPAVVNKYFTASNRKPLQEWTSAPVPDYTGPIDDAQLIERAMNSRSASAAFGGKASFADLWQCNTEALADAYPDDVLGTGSRAFDASSADAALAQHLAFWTGKDCARILRLMWQSRLVRDKWNRDDYLERTILNACANQSDTLTGTNDGGPKLSGSLKQQEYAKQIRAGVLAQANGEQVALLTATHGPAVNAKFWIDHKAETPAQLAERCRPVDLGTTAAPPAPAPGSAADVPQGAEIRVGYQYLAAEQQIEYFRGCVYVQSAHAALTPDGELLKPERFNAVYGGYSFQLEADGSGKTTRKAWDAFTESQAVTFPKVASTCFRPDLAPGQIIVEDGRRMANAYVPIDTPRKQGDPAPFLCHLEKLLPDPGDRAILLAYMAACVQHKGVKFQWAPLIQGAEGNGKTLFTRCVAFAIGERYTHLPPAEHLTEKYNEWLFDRLFIGVEDVYVPEHKREVIETLKPMITNTRLAMRAMQQSQVMRDVCANFILNTNHKDGIRKTTSDRRFCVFYTAQQSIADIERDGLGGDYFPDLYDWLKGTGRYAREGAGHGYAIVSDYLMAYSIPDELNPARSCHRAPTTTSTTAAIAAGLGGVEQEICEAIEEGRPGFAGGWVSSVALDRLLTVGRTNRAIPINKRRELLQALGYDWHPALNEGRVNNAIPMDDNKKPRLFIRSGHIHANLTTTAEVVKAYIEAQSAATVPPGSAAEAFR
jgi:hypothetical protein